MNVKMPDKIGLAQTSLFLAVVAGVLFAKDSGRQNNIKNLKSQISAVDSLRFKRVSDKTKNKPLSVQEKIWEDAYKEFFDSLKKNGEANKNYFEGAQMINDSIKNLK